MPASSKERALTLGLRTDLAIESGRSIVEEHEGFLSVRTPGNPGYHFGNFLIFDGPPENGDEQRWPQRFESLFGSDAGVRHAAFAWGGPDMSAAQRFIDAGYTLERRAVMTAREVPDFPVPAGLHVRKLRCDNDWNGQYELDLAARKDAYEPEGYARFARAQVDYRRSIAAQFGTWLGAFDGDRLVGSCGIFSLGDGIARYQDVNVLADYRNRGVARCLIGAAGRYALERFRAALLVIVADSGDFPIRIYEKCGFALYERENALWVAVR